MYVHIERRANRGGEPLERKDGSTKGNVMKFNEIRNLMKQRVASGNKNMGESISIWVKKI
jgi:hypothetical protein